jgi:hypothetical protein
MTEREIEFKVSGWLKALESEEEMIAWIDGSVQFDLEQWRPLSLHQTSQLV